jgi:hypothetical protein
MNKVGRLLKTYERHVALPWQPELAASKRVLFCVYDPEDERAIRARIGEFELATINAGHRWGLFDITDSFAQWLSGEEYASSYFREPECLNASLFSNFYIPFIQAGFAQTLDQTGVGENDIVAVLGTGSLFGILLAREVVAVLAPTFPGRLLVFFPGTFTHSNYRLLDAYDGWNYLAVPITADPED